MDEFDSESCFFYRMLKNCKKMAKNWRKHVNDEMKVSNGRYCTVKLVVNILVGLDLARYLTS